MDAPTSIFLTHPEDNSSVANLYRWAAKNLDAEVIGNVVKITSGIDMRGEIVKEKAKYTTEHPDEKPIIIESRGAEIPILEFSAIRTSVEMRREISERKASSNAPLRLPFPEDWQPYIVEQIVKYWSTGTLSIKKEKTLTLATRPPSNPADTDITESMTTTMVLLNIYHCSYILADEPLREFVVWRLKFNLTRPFYTQEELLEALEVVYRSETPDAYDEVRRILLSALVRQAVDISFGEMGDKFTLLRRHYPKLSDDFTFGMMYYDHHLASKAPRLRISLEKRDRKQERRLEKNRKRVRGSATGEERVRQSIEDMNMLD